jgi:sigma-E factor negative regulatory protein RseA
MKDRISALMDSEMDDRSAAATIDALARDSEARGAWRTYQLISDAMRGGRLLSDGFGARLAARLAGEPTVLAPRSAAWQSEPRRWYALSAAASVAAVALVGWMAFGPQPQLVPAAPPAPHAQPKPETKPPVMVPMPTAANDYLLAHQGFSPRMSLQGIAPYVRTVSEHVQEPRR